MRGQLASPSRTRANPKVADAAMLMSLCAVVSAVFLALCVALANPWWGYAAVAVSLVGVAVFVIDRMLRRRAATPVEAAEDVADEAEAEESVEPVEPDAIIVSDDEIVATVPGRRRFHLLSCELLPAGEFEEITESEARAEGFTPCSSCFPVTVVKAGSGAA